MTRVLKSEFFGGGPVTAVVIPPTYEARLFSVDPSPTNPYRTPKSEGARINEPPAKPKIFSFLLSLGLLFVLTTVLSPPDTGIWLNWAVISAWPTSRRHRIHNR